MVELIEWESGKEFAEAEIMDMREKRLGEIGEADFEGHEKFESKEAMLEEYKKYYGDRVTMDTPVKMIRFKLIQIEGVMKYNKLVRDNIPEIIKAKGEVPMIHIAADAEYWQKLKEKLQEEVDEFLKDENIGEIADILEVLDAICDYKGFDKHEVEGVKEKKAKERGEFAKRIILNES